MIKKSSANIFLKIFLVICLFAVTATTLVASSKTLEAKEEQVEITTTTVNLFNSYNTSSSGRNDSYLDGTYNRAPNTFENNGYDVYIEGTTGGTSSYSYSQVGLDFEIKSPIVEIATVTMYAFDVDEEQGEMDEIYLVNVTKGTSIKLGKLHGMNQSWNTTTFRVDPSEFEVGCTYHLAVKGVVTGWVVYIRTCSIQLTSTGSYEDINPVGPSIEDHAFNSSIDAYGNVSCSLYLKPSETVQLKVEYVANYNGDQRGQAHQTVTFDAEGSTTETTFTLEGGSAQGTYQVDVVIKDMYNNVIVSYTTTSGFNSVSVKYNPNGGSNNIPLDKSSYQEGSTVTVLFDYVPSLTGYVFLGWSTDAEAKKPEFTKDGLNTFVIGEEDVTLYAVWTLYICDHEFSDYEISDKEHSHVCTKCLKTFSSRHLYDAGTVIQEATEDAHGIREYKCTECGHVQYGKFTLNSTGCFSAASASIVISFIALTSVFTLLLKKH